MFPCGSSGFDHRHYLGSPHHSGHGSEKKDVLQQVLREVTSIVRGSRDIDQKTHALLYTQETRVQYPVHKVL